MPWKNNPMNRILNQRKPRKTILENSRKGTLTDRSRGKTNYHKTKQKISLEQYKLQMES